MMFQAEMEMNMEMYLDEDEGDNSLETNVLSSAISTKHASVTTNIGLVIAFLLMVAFCIDCSLYSFFHDVSGGNENEHGNVSWRRQGRQLT